MGIYALDIVLFHHVSLVFVSLSPNVLWASHRNEYLLYQQNWKLPIQNNMYYFKNKNLIDIIQS